MGQTNSTCRASEQTAYIGQQALAYAEEEKLKDAQLKRQRDFNEAQERRRDLDMKIKVKHTKKRQRKITRKYLWYVIPFSCAIVASYVFEIFFFRAVVL